MSVLYVITDGASIHKRGERLLVESPEDKLLQEVEVRRLESVMPGDSRRLAVAKALEDFGDRVQYSMFEVRLEETELELLQARILREIDPSEDKVRLYPFCEECRKKSLDLGLKEKEPFAEPDVVIV